MTIAFIIVLWETCFTSTDGMSWACFSKPAPTILCVRSPKRFECQFVPFQPRRVV